MCTGIKLALTLRFGIKFDMRGLKFIGPILFGPLLQCSCGVDVPSARPLSSGPSRVSTSFSHEYYLYRTPDHRAHGASATLQASSQCTTASVLLSSGR